jgi:hypothetical protein
MQNYKLERGRKYELTVRKPLRRRRERRKRRSRRREG